MLNYDQIHKSNSAFPGNFRAVVEDNADPKDMGRVRVRIQGIHSPDPEVTKVDELPWAEAALSITNSGGNNVNAVESDDPNRYNPDGGGKSKAPARNSTQLQEVYQDDYISNTGTGGQFVVPRKGTVVWIFFEGGDHTRPHYWATSPSRIDYVEQKNKISQDVADRIKIQDELNTELNKNHRNGAVKATGNKGTPGAKPSIIDPLLNALPAGAEAPEDTDPDKSALVQTDIPPAETRQDEISPETRNHNITSVTTAAGETVVNVEEEGKERTYLIHKSFMREINENGQVHDSVGKDPQNETDDWNDYRMSVGGNHELYVLGDYNIRVKGNCQMMIDKDFQMRVSGKVGILSDNKNVDVVATKGNINIESIASDVKINSGKNQQQVVRQDRVSRIARNDDLQIGGDSNITINGNHKFQINGDADMNVGGECKLAAAGDVYSQAGGKNIIKGNDDILIDSERAIHLYGTGDAYLFGQNKVNIKSTAKVTVDGDTEVVVNSPRVTIAGSNGAPATQVQIEGINVQLTANGTLNIRTPSFNVTTG